MNRNRPAFFCYDLHVADILCALSIVVVALMVVIFLAGCETTKTDQTDSDSTIRKTDDTPQVHGQVDAMYGFGR
jgi:pectin methylesterase-like acyl-CoA thioesterase